MKKENEIILKVHNVNDTLCKKSEVQVKVKSNVNEEEKYNVWIGDTLYKVPDEITYDELEGLYGEEYLAIYGINPPMTNLKPEDI